MNSKEYRVDRRPGMMSFYPRTVERERVIRAYAASRKWKLQTVLEDAVEHYFAGTDWELPPVMPEEKAS